MAHNREEVLVCGLSLTWAQASFPLANPSVTINALQPCILPAGLPNPRSVFRSFIPEEQYQGRPSQLLLQAALAHMHYLPEEPGAAGARASSYWQMAQLLQYRAVSARDYRRLWSRPCTNNLGEVVGQWRWVHREALE